MPHHQQDDGSHSNALAALLVHRDGFSIPEARVALRWQGSSTALAEHLKRHGFTSRKVNWTYGARLLFFPPAPLPPAKGDIVYVPEWSLTLPDNPMPQNTGKSDPVWRRVNLQASGGSRAQNFSAHHGEMVGEADESGLLEPDDGAVAANLIDQFDPHMIDSIGGNASEADFTKRKDLDSSHCDSPSSPGNTLARRRIESTDPEIRSRLRRVRASMVSGPDVLGTRSRWRAFHLRADRAAFGDTGPARPSPDWTHLAAALIGAVIMLAIAGAK